MFDQRAYIHRLESAGPDELRQMLARPTVEEEKALRLCLGDQRYQCLHSLALKRGMQRALRQPDRDRNVVVIHGIMGSELTAVDRRGAADQIWVRALRLMAGAIARLRLSSDGLREYDSDYDVRASGILKRYYGELLLSLSGDWNVRAFWFDWRKDLNTAAAALEAQISGWFGREDPVHIVAHSMGGLVARTFVHNYPGRWTTMRQKREDGKGWVGGRLIMLGTPNHGSFAIPQVIMGLERTVRWLDLADMRHNRAEILTILNSFIGTYQMLPSPLVHDEADQIDALYRSETYGTAGVPQRHLDNALAHHRRLKNAVDPERMIYIAGSNQPTFSGIRDLSKLAGIEGYRATMRGDGRVSHALGVLKKDAREVPTYYVEETHGALPSNQKILAVLTELLETGSTDALSRTPPATRAAAGDDARTAQELLQKQEAETNEEEQHLRSMVAHLRLRSGQLYSGFGSPRAASSGNNPSSIDFGLRLGAGETGSPALDSGPSTIESTDLASNVSPAERDLERTLLEGVLTDLDIDERRGKSYVLPPTRIEIALVCGRIEEIGMDGSENPPVDAIAVGHYLGVKPQQAEQDLDEAISRVFLRRPEGELGDGDRLLTQYTERGIIRGELGQPFFLQDPRAVEGLEPGAVSRVIAIAGMGLPGRFGVPELTVLARELCWSLGQMEKHHLATVLIGAGHGNLSVGEAVSGWIRGIKHAITGSAENEQRRLKRITFLELDPKRIEPLQKAILEEKQRLADQNRLIIDYQAISPEELTALKQKALEQAHRDLERQHANSDDQEELAPTRITLGLEGQTYRFGAITQNASIPERTVPLDPKLVNCANDELAGEQDPSMQVERGRFLERLLVPSELRQQLTTPAPIVMILDAVTARVHWEMVAQSDLTTAVDAQERRSDGSRPFDSRCFLGTSRGFTRQLRTTFAPPPEPPPPPRRVLRVLVVADPAEDAHLPGAEEEGVVVADLFAGFDRTYERSLSREKNGLELQNQVEVVRLFGPREATRTNVLRHLMLRSYDVLHFAGHCIYDREQPAASGWVFTGGERLTANELNRIDRIPKFVFSNACESGVTPDRSGDRSAELAPSFAESFFLRGVSNFVCTAWPVDDAAARQFALKLYSSLLGLKPVDGCAVDGCKDQYEPDVPQPMYRAMQQARISIAQLPNGVRSWGAYQHYGSPYFRLFYPETLRQQSPPRAQSNNSRDRAARHDPPTSKRATRPDTTSGNKRSGAEADQTAVPETAEPSST